MEKGFNKLLLDTKNMLTIDLNKALQNGVPIVAIQIILEAMLSDVKNLATGMIAKENQEIENEKKKDHISENKEEK